MTVSKVVIKKIMGEVEGYFLRNEFHKKGGPAFINKGRRHPSISWYINGTEYTNVVDYCKACGYNKQIQALWVLKYGNTLPSKLDQLQTGE